MPTNLEGFCDFCREPDDDLTPIDEHFACKPCYMEIENAKHLAKQYANKP
jgi:hypothetical protein